jgi:NADPH2:quinone reductase
MKAIIYREYGGPEVLEYEERPTPTPGPGQALVRVSAAGVNFIDIYQRLGWYKGPLPAIPGNEGAGVVESVGEGVTEASPGERVAWFGGSGCYAEYALVPADKLAPLPDVLGFEQGAAAMVQGITAYVLAHVTYPLKLGDRCLVHAAAGGVGLLLCQIAKHEGAFVIGTTSTPEKAALARAAGADEVILYTEQDFLEEVKRITGRGVNVVYDSVGKDTFDRSLESLAPLGYLVSYGQSSGFPAPLDIQRLGGMRSAFVTRPSVFAYVQERAKYLAYAGAVFDMAVAGTLTLRIGGTYALANAADAHIALAGRQTTGKLVLIP